MFDAFRVREAAELAPSYAMTRLTLDVYCLQHPDRYCVSAKSLAAHLTGLAWAMEHESWEVGHQLLQRWLNGRVPLVKPPLPDSRGAITIGDVHHVTDRQEYSLAVVRWARSTWDAYAPLQVIARAWMAQAVSQA
jgi:hypothetical protein